MRGWLAPSSPHRGTGLPDVVEGLRIDAVIIDQVLAELMVIVEAQLAPGALMDSHP